ncbi:hypothetical protein [Deinococcus sonorensis]|uniref:Uncharacterized protein n=2 Tax=Deinococcus sonorensis TaxID=309891 RepID=A0AAU7U6M0_9DEIO
MPRIPGLLALTTLSLVLAACGQTTPDPHTTQSAHLTLTVSAPQGVNPNITVSGPVGFSKTITTTGSAWLDTQAFGTYSWASMTVKAGDFTYAGSNGSVVLAANDVRTATVSYLPIDSALNFTLHAPAGVTPHVTLRGPDNFTKTFTTAETVNLIGLKPGTYTWTAEQVTAGEVTYAATDGSIELPAGEAQQVSDTYAAIVGTLDLSVSVPDGVTPNVAVTGPDTFSTTVTTAGAVKVTGLKPGTYTIAPSSVIAKGFRYDAQGATAAVVSGHTATASVSYTGGVDIEAPTNVTFTPASSSADSSGFAHLTVTAQDNAGVKEFIVYANTGDVRMATLAATKSADGYSASYSPWIPHGFPQSFTVVASDGVNVSARSTEVFVTNPNP